MHGIEVNYKQVMCGIEVNYSQVMNGIQVNYNKVYSTIIVIPTTNRERKITPGDFTTRRQLFS